MLSTLSNTLSVAIKNPSRQMAKNFLSVVEDGEVRGAIDPETGDILIWRATEATHQQIAECMNVGLIDEMALFRLNSPDQIDTIIMWS